MEAHQPDDGRLSVLIALFLCLLMVAGEAAAAPLAGRVVIDGVSSDWDGEAPIYESHAQEAAAGPHIIQVWARSDRERLALRLRLSSDVLLQGNSGLVLHIDTDANSSTGRAIDGLGADFSWSFSGREGRAQVMDVPLRLIQSDVDLRMAPSVSASEFEISLARRISVAGAPLIPGSRIALTLRNESSGQIVSSTGRIDLVLTDEAPPPPSPVGVPAKPSGHLRVLTYNVLFDGCFARPLPFRNILGALDPDIVSLQEIYRHSVDQTLEWIERVLPDNEWHGAGFGQGVILSKFPVLDQGMIGTERRGAWALLDTPDGPLALVNPHAPCCENDRGRQEEFDALTAWIRDARASGLLKPETPVVVAGDLNLVGDARQLATLLNGTIVDTTTHGPAAPPDGDGTPLADAMPYHLSETEAYTWRSDRSAFSPGKLDYIVYTDSVLGLGTSFVLWTPELSPDALREAGLEVDDSARASDHLPVVADFYFRSAASPR